MPIRVFIQAFQLRQMFRHSRIRQRLTIASIVASRQGNKMIADNPYDIQVVMQTLQRFIMKEFMGRVSHGLSGIRYLSPTKWEADTLPRDNAWYVCQPDIIHYTTFLTRSQVFLTC